MLLTGSLRLAVFEGRNKNEKRIAFKSTYKNREELIIPGAINVKIRIYLSIFLVYRKIKFNPPFIMTKYCAYQLVREGKI